MHTFFILVKDEEGATAIEYACIALLIALVIIASISYIGHTVNNTFVGVNNGFAQSQR